MPLKTLTIALAGNPNSGKTTIFNSITGTRQKVGNWPGVTVEKKEGIVSRNGYQLKIVDLPGTYSLTPFSIEEIIARDFILEGNPDVVVDIIDASNLERSLYLATQIRELGCKVLYVLNMEDLARARGVKIDGVKLSRLLAVPVVFTVGNRNQGIEDLLSKAVELAESGSPAPQERRVKYSRDIEKCIDELHGLIQGAAMDGLHYPPRWTAIKLLEADNIVADRVRKTAGSQGEAILGKAGEQRQRLLHIFDEEPEILLTDERYGFIAGIVREVLTTSTRERVDVSRNIDRVLTNRFLGFPIFVFFIWVMFFLTFSLGAYPMDWIELGVNRLSVALEHWLPGGLLKQLLLDGIVAGVGSVIVFLPNILILFFCISIFEDTGYMARAAFLMDRIMHLIGLHGKSFIPMLMGFGCNVPAIMATRTLESQKDRILTILITPFMSCSARLPIYIVLAGTFFPAHAGTVIFAIYLLGIGLSIVTGRLFRSTLLKGADAPFVMELPPYRVPMLKSLLIHMWDRGKMFLRKMGGVILIGSVAVWFLASFPRYMPAGVDPEVKAMQTGSSQIAEIPGSPSKAEQAENSYMARMGKTLAPVFEPVGIDWRGSVALLTGLVAKEIVVSTMGILHSADEMEGPDALARALRSSGMTPLSALSMMAFVLLYVPCLASVAAIRKETNSFRWTLVSIAYSTGLAWIVALVIYQGGKLLGYA